MTRLLSGLMGGKLSRISNQTPMKETLSLNKNLKVQSCIFIMFSLDNYKFSNNIFFFLVRLSVVVGDMLDLNLRISQPTMPSPKRDHNFMDLQLACNSLETSNMRPQVTKQLTLWIVFNNLQCTCYALKTQVDL